MEKLVLVNALADFGFDLLTSSEKVRNIRGYWGETMEIRLDGGIVFVYIDETACGFIKRYANKENDYAKLEEIPITRATLYEELKKAVKKIEQK
ncbi:MAG: hypothetical protein IJ031_03305 [Oscillospiraceae bacterium]|nr:hypothetical protein [Oscillospiraceae bacterium]